MNATAILMPAKGGIGQITIKPGVTHWHMKDQRLIRPQEMTDDHLLRVLRMYCTCRWVNLRVLTAGDDDSLRRRLGLAASIPLAQQIMDVLWARHEWSMTPIAARLAVLSDVYVPSDYSGATPSPRSSTGVLRLWSMSPPAKWGRLPSSAIERSSDPLWDSYGGNS